MINIPTFFLGNLTAGLIQCFIVATILTLIALKQKSIEPLKAIVFLSVVYIFDLSLLSLPKISLFQGLYWNWQGKILQFLWPLIMVYGFKWMSPNEIGLNKPEGPFGFIKTILLGFVFAGLSIVISLCNESSSTNAPLIETLLFQFTMPGLGEEIIFRGVCLAILNRYLSKDWLVWNVKFGWGLIIVSILFVLAHAIVYNKTNNTITWGLDGIELAMITLMSFTFGFVREKTKSIWPVVVLHNLINGLVSATLTP